MFREITANYNGQELHIIPDMRLLQRIENKGISLFKVTQEAAKGNPQLSLISAILGEVLRYAGQNVTDEELFTSFYTGEGGGENLAMFQAIALHLIPEAAVKKLQPLPETAETPEAGEAA